MMVYTDKEDFYVLFIGLGIYAVSNSMLWFYIFKTVIPRQQLRLNEYPGCGFEFKGAKI